MHEDANPNPRRKVAPRPCEATVYLRLLDEHDEIATVLIKHDSVIAAVPRIGEGYVIADSDDVPVSYVAHDTVSGRHVVLVYLDMPLGDRDASEVIDAHTSAGWSVGYDEHESSTRLD